MIYNINLLGTEWRILKSLVAKSLNFVLSFTSPNVVSDAGVKIEDMSRWRMKKVDGKITENVKGNCTNKML